MLVHDTIVLLDHLKYLLLARLHDVAPNDQFFKNEVSLVEIENEVQLAHVAKVAVKYFDEVVDHIKRD